jgi:hypothetical protein
MAGDPLRDPSDHQKVWIEGTEEQCPNYITRSLANTPPLAHDLLLTK